MENLLLVSGQDDARNLLAAWCREVGCAPRALAASASEARAWLRDNTADIVLLHAPPSDETTRQLALETAQTSLAGVILLDSSAADDPAGPLRQAGVFVLPWPIDAVLFRHALQLALVAQHRIRQLHSGTRQLQDKLEDMRLIHRAKCALIQYLNMTEPQAHRYIEKQAMDRRQPRRIIAQNILNTYEE